MKHAFNKFTNFVSRFKHEFQNKPKNTHQIKLWNIRLSTITVTIIWMHHGIVISPRLIIQKLIYITVMWAVSHSFISLLFVERRQTPDWSTFALGSIAVLLVLSVWRIDDRHYVILSEKTAIIVYKFYSAVPRRRQYYKYSTFQEW